MMYKRFFLVAALLAAAFLALSHAPAWALNPQIGLSVNTIDLGPAGAPIAPFDLNNTAGIVNKYGTGTSYGTTRDYLKAAYSAGTWTGNGITSTAAKVYPGLDQGIGIMGGALYHTKYGAGTNFYGEPVNDSAALLKYTWLGDANIDGQLTPSDYGAIDTQFTDYGYFQPALWAQGDFNHDGQLSPTDYGLIDTTYTNTGYFVVIPLRGGNAGMTTAAASGMSAVPEPSTVVLLLAGCVAAALLLRRKK